MHRAALTLLLAGLFGLTAQLLFYREGIGLNGLLAVALLFAVGWRLRRATPPRLDLWMPAFAFAFAAFLAIRTEMAVVAFNVLAVLVLAAAWSASLRGASVMRLPFPHLLAEAWETITGTLWRALPTTRDGLRALPLGALRRNRLLPVLGGVLLALPLVLIFGSLFTSADPVFARWWEDLIDVAGWAERVREWRERLIIAIVAAWIVLGALAWPARNREERLGSALLGSVTATTFLVTIGALFAVFVSIQLAYLFGGRDTLEAAGITYADYARRGFFELLAVAALTGVVLFALDLATGRRARAYGPVAVILLGLTGVILLSSLYRLALYQQEYGWSEQRLYAVAMIAAVAAGLAILAAAVATRRMRHAVQPIVFAALAIALVVNAVGPAGFIVRSNVSRLGPQFDPWYLVQLGPAGLPELVAAREGLPAAERACVDLLLYYRYAQSDRDEPSWQSWDVDRERARLALVALDEDLFFAKGQPPTSACTAFAPATGTSRR